ncbi:MAG TPA: HupE/UreJ family protein [Puia sp.]|nr:HupE/UreJ family protein [Puia sp.]
MEIREVGANRITIFWKQPVSGETGIYLTPLLSNGWLTDSASLNSATGIALIRQWEIKTTQTISGQTITIDGLKNTITDVLVSITFRDGTNLTRIIRPSDPVLVVDKNQHSALPVFDYLRLGIEHILFGIDHLLFVLALILIVKGKRRLLKTVTAFTLAHSITLAAATLGWVHIASAPAEAVIALSIIFLAVELVHFYQGKAVFSSRYPWVVAFIFGLLHGLGFAGALANVGLPEHAIPLALFLFNVGVETGQIIFILSVMLVIRTLHATIKNIPNWARWISPYAIGCMAAFWFFQRLAIIYFP